MGFNSTMVILNDALHAIAEDPKFGEKVYRAVLMVGRGPQDICSGGFVNAATVYETHHADTNRVIIVGGNRALVTDGGAFFSGYVSDEELELAALRDWADRLGYRVSKKPKPKRR